MFTFVSKKNMEKEIEPVIVLGNIHGGCIDIDLEDDDQCCIILKQGKKMAALVGDIDLLIGTGLEPGHKLKGQIITKEQLEPFDSENPQFLLKKLPNGTVCKKGGIPIYSYNYFTYNKKEVNEIIEPDNI